MVRRTVAFILAVLGAYLLGSVLATQVILKRLSELGLPVTLRDRLHAMGHDLLGLATSYLPLLAAALLVALPVAAGLAHWLPRARLFLYLLAGAGAVVTLHLVARAVLGVNGLAAVRTVPGLALQALAGAFGAYVFFVATGWARRPDPGNAAPPHV